MSFNRSNLISLGFVALGFASAGGLYSRLPEMMPTHWSASGVADGFTPKPWGPLILPLIMLGVWLLLAAIPAMSPRGFRVERFKRTFDIIQVSTLAFLFFVNVLVLLAGIGVPVAMGSAIFAGIGLLFIILGNYMGKLTRNFFVGIRTPWTLASDEVWLRTHRLGGKLFVLGGLILFVSGLLDGGMIPLVVALVIAAGIPVVYSYVIYRRLEGTKHGV